MRYKRLIKQRLSKTQIGNLKDIKEYYGFNDKKAIHALEVLNNEQIEQIKKRLYKGGKNKS
jgi:hypothetical protein|tara:strand:+ start:988 stop:1170 length:183 start_codon:yes stop_codon:yes gene_type:complete